MSPAPETRSIAPWLLAAASWLVLAACVWRLDVPGSRTMERGWTDHLSHRGVATWLLHRGTEPWRVPATAALAHDDSDETRTFAADRRLNASDFFLVDGLRVFVNWPTHVRPYPPLAFVLALPEALLEGAGVPPDTAAFISTMKMLGMACVLLVLLGTFARDTVRTSPRSPGAWVVAWVLLVAAAHVVWWGANGFYDAAAVAAVWLSILRLRDGRSSSALAWWAVGAGLHFRALWFLPVGALAAWRTFLAWKSGGISKRDVSGILVAVLVGLPSAWVLWTVGPALATFPRNNGFLFTSFGVPPVVLAGMLAAAATVAGARGNDRAFVLCAAFVPAAVVAVTPQVMQWHALMLLPLLPLATLSPKPPFLAVGATLVGTALLFFDVSYVDPSVFPALVRALAG